MTEAVLLMAYGSPRSLDEVEPYLRDIRGGRAVSAESVAELTERYRRAGVPSPLLEVSRRQAEALQASMPERRVYVGMKHWHPYIREAVGQIVADGASRVTGVALAPHYSRISIGGYADRVRAAAEELGGTFTFTMVESWYRQEPFVRLVARNLGAALDGWGEARVFFSAHSLPARILHEGDPYRDQLLDSAAMIAERAGIDDWEFAFQSASATGEPWLGPDIVERLTSFAAEGGKRAVVAPIGFVTDHLEILFDIDVECAELAQRLGFELRRIASPNDDPLLAEALRDAVAEASS
jgi:ferrochelatase